MLIRLGLDTLGLFIRNQASHTTNLELCLAKPSHSLNFLEDIVVTTQVNLLADPQISTYHDLNHPH